MTIDHRPPATDQGRSAASEVQEHEVGRSVHGWERPRSTAQRPPANPGRAATLLASFGYAFGGIGYLIRTQRNAKIHCAITAVVIALGLGLGIERVEWVALVITIALVLAAEGVNTAVEATVDLASPGYHPIAKVAKDVAAGTVLLTAIAAVAVGALIFLPRLWPIVLWLLAQ